MSRKKSGLRYSSPKPRIVLVGIGKFGCHHARVLKRLHGEGAIEFAGIVVRDPKKRAGVAAEFGVPIYPELSLPLLKSVDAVDIVTPPDTHYGLIRKCLPHASVFVEKPLAKTEAECLKLGKLARSHKRVLSAGHIFRFHPVTLKLKEILGKKKMPRKISGAFINPAAADDGREPSLEFLHLFDIVDFLWKKDPALVYSRAEGRVTAVDIRYQKNCDASFALGWRAEEKLRTLSFRYDGMTVAADFAANMVTVAEGLSRKSYECPVAIEPLYAELAAFAAELRGKKTALPDAALAARIVSIAERAVPQPIRKPRVAVIGGGIFGTSIAAELGKSCSVALFEKNAELLREGSFINQFRHHRGYHYPRSDETVEDIKVSRGDFEEAFKDAIVDTYPTYYGLAKKDSLVSKAQFIAFCKRHGLPYREAFPPAGLMAESEMQLSVEVPEANYHHERLSAIVKDRLSVSPDTKVVYGAEVTGCALSPDGRKVISYKKGKAAKRQEFDFVINAMYANINRFAHWLGFEHYLIRVDLAEVLIVKLPIDPVSVTIIDGPFATLMPTGNKHEFTLYHVTESILDRYVPEDGLVRKVPERRSNQKAIFEESMKLFPILKDAEIVETRIVHRGVQAFREHDDKRVADIVSHGFGCWSVLSGKILSSVTVGKRLASIVAASSAKGKTPSRKHSS